MASTPRSTLTVMRAAAHGRSQGDPSSQQGSSAEAETILLFVRPLRHDVIVLRRAKESELLGERRYVHIGNHYGKKEIHSVR